MKCVINFVFEICCKFLALDLLWWDALRLWGGSDEGGSGLVGENKVDSGLGVGSGQ